MDLDQLQSFNTVARIKNFSRAALELNVTQPTVSSRILKLEQELGTVLFNRMNHSLSLTPEGELFLSYSQRVVNQIEEAKQIINVTKKPLIKIGLAPNISPSLFSEVFRKIDLKKVNILVEDRIGSHQLVEKILEGQLDIALTITQFKNKDLYFEKIVDDPIVFAVSKEHHLAQHDVITPEVLDGETIIRIEKKTSLLWPDVASILDQINLNYIESNQEEMLKELVINGHGFSLFPIHYINSNDLKRLKVIPFKELNQIPKEVYIASKMEYSNDKYFLLFVQELKELFNKQRETFKKLNLIL